MLIKNFGGTAMRNKIKITIKQVAVTLFMHSDVFRGVLQAGSKVHKEAKKTPTKACEILSRIKVV